MASLKAPFGFVTEEMHPESSSSCPRCWDPHLLLSACLAQLIPTTITAQREGPTSASREATQQQSTGWQQGHFTEKSAASEASSRGPDGRGWGAVVLQERKRAAPLTRFLIGLIHLNVKRKLWWKDKLMHHSTALHLPELLSYREQAEQNNRCFLQVTMLRHRSTKLLWNDI